MLRIAHLADIHIRSLSRHDEYREVFNEFIDDCRQQKVDHIFIGGDIFHTKTTGISPEYIDFLRWWLESMSKVAKVHLTLGNHDGNLVNLSRQDAVSPIVAALNNPNICLYKKSGMYEFSPGYVWCVYSLFDEEGWKEVNPIPGKINIACYHGPVHGSVTEVGWNIENDLRVEFFKDYPFVFLGDIHKMQHLGYREGKPWISYPGTPIQQSYGEDLEHGYLLWDIQSVDDWNVTFRKLSNPKPYVTLNWSGDNDSLLKEALKFPQNARFRIKSNVQINQDNIQKISELLKENRNAIEVTFKSDYKIDSTTIKTSNVIVEKADLRSPEVITNLLHSYCKSNNIPQFDNESILSQVKKYVSNITSTDEISRGSKWSLQHLKWDNMFVYGEDNEIDFSKLNGIIGIFGPNRTGKSSVVGTIMYSLFNTTDRGPMKNIHVCNVRKPVCYSRAIIDYNGKPYVIERQTTKSANKKGVVSASTSLNLFRMNESGEMDDLCGEQRTDTEKTIRSLIGTSEDFLMTSLSAQGESNAFISQGSTKRRSILSRFLDLDVFDKLFELANKDVSSYKSQLKNFPERDWSQEKLTQESLIKDLKEKVSTIEETISIDRLKLDELKNKLSSHKDVKPVTQSDVLLQEKKLFSLKTSADECRNNISNFESEVISLKEKLKIVEEVEASDDIETLKSQIASIEAIEKNIIDLTHLYEKEATLLQQQRKSLKILDEVPCGDSFPTCKFIKDAYENHKKIDSQELNVTKSAQKLNAAKNSISEFDKKSILERISKLEKASSLSSKIKLEISKKETEIERCRSSCENCVKNLLEAEKALDDMKEALKNESNLEVVSIRSQIEELSRVIKDLDNQRVSFAMTLGRAEAELEKLSSEKETRDSILSKMKIFEVMSSAFSKKGLPLQILRTQLPLINAEISRILQGIVDFSIELENDEEADVAEIYINYGDSKRVIELCSGMEKMVASIALRVALTNISSLSKSDIFIIDEGFGALDDAGVEACGRLLTSLKKHFKTILVITHVDGIKDIADHIIEITKNEKDSRVFFA